MQAPVVLKPEPRHLPSRNAPVEVIAKQMPEPAPHDGRRKSSPGPAPLPKHPKRRSLVARVSMLLVFLALSIALVYGVLTILKTQIERESMQQDRPAVSDSSPVASPSTAAVADQLNPTPGEPPVPAATDTITGSAQSLPTPAATQKELVQPPPPMPDGLEAKSPGMEALAVLERFLNAKSLAERLPLIETKTPEAEITNSCLASPLPPARNVVIDAQESNPIEGVVDYFYNVDFEIEGNQLNPQTLLVRTRGSNPPKVVVDPFLDLYGGRLAAYAASPQEKGAHFQVIIYPLPSCNDPNIRDREKKLTLKLMARNNTKEIALAYFSKASKIGEMLVNGSYELSYGTPKPCTVMLRWNTEENKEHPYLEAIDIKALDWNP